MEYCNAFGVHSQAVIRKAVGAEDGARAWNHKANNYGADARSNGETTQNIKHPQDASSKN